MNSSGLVKGVWAGILPWVGAVTVASVVGFGVGRMTAPGGGWSAGEKQVTLKNGENTKARGNSESSFAQEKDEGGASVNGLAGALAQSDPKVRDRELSNSLSRASLAEIKKALEWAGSLPEGAGKRAVLAKILERWGQLDGAGAAAYAEKVFAETGNPALLREALRGWGETDPDAAMKYVQSAGLSGGMQRDMTRDIFRDWADRNPQAAAAYAASETLDVGRGGATSLVSDRWSKQDPQATAKWAMGLPEGKDQQRALDQLIQNWSDLDIKGAAQFVNSQPAGANRDTMVSTLAKEVAKEDPVAGLQWTASLGDVTLQERTAMGVLWRTARQDPALAQKYVQESKLSPAVQQAVMARMTNNSGGRGGW